MTLRVVVSITPAQRPGRARMFPQEPVTYAGAVPDAVNPSLPAAPRGSRTAAAALCAVQSLALLGFAAFYLYELGAGEGDDAGRVVMSALVILLAAVGLAALARGWTRWTRWPRTPTVVWDLLLLPVGFSLLGAGTTLPGAAVLAVAVLTLVAAFRAPQPDEDLGEAGGNDLGEDPSDTPDPDA